MNSRKKVLIVGDPLHPEVTATSGWCTGEVRIVKNGEETEKVIEESKAVFEQQSEIVKEANISFRNILLE